MNKKNATFSILFLINSADFTFASDILLEKYENNLNKPILNINANSENFKLNNIFYSFFNSEYNLANITSYLSFREIETLSCVNHQVHHLMQEEKINKIIEDQFLRIKRAIRYYLLMKVPFNIEKPSIVLTNLNCTSNVKDTIDPQGKFNSSRRLIKSVGQLKKHQKLMIDEQVLARIQYFFPHLGIKYVEDPTIEIDYSKDFIHPSKLENNLKLNVKDFLTSAIMTYSIDHILSYVDFKDFQTLTCTSNQFRIYMEKIIFDEVLKSNVKIAENVIKLLPIYDSLKIIYDAIWTPMGFPININSEKIDELCDPKLEKYIHMLHIERDQLHQNLEHLCNSVIHKYFKNLNNYSQKKQNMDNIIYTYMNYKFPQTKFKFPIRIANLNFEECSNSPNYCFI